VFFWNLLWDYWNLLRASCGLLELPLACWSLLRSPGWSLLEKSPRNIQEAPGDSRRLLEAPGALVGGALPSGEEPVGISWSRPLLNKRNPPAARIDAL